MSYFTTKSLKMEFFDDDEKIAKLLEEIHFEMDEKGSGKWLVVPEGFPTNGASVPRLLWAFLPPWGTKASKAAVLHDYLYYCLMNNINTWVKTYEQADYQLFLALRALKVNKIKSYIVWYVLKVITFLFRRNKTIS